ncbi:MAG: winged helix-turn-helix domain-containing protein [Halothiobacillus sp.]
MDAGTRQPKLIILDLGLPDGNGVDFIRDVRGWSAVPIIVLSARSDEQDKIAALDAGADDYLTKPFGVGELLARVRVALRRPNQDSTADESLFVFGKIVVDLSHRQVTRDQQAIHLTPIEYRLLTLLVRNIGRVLTHRQLLREIWGPSHTEHAHYVRIYMAQLRHKLEDDPTQPRHFLTEAGIGYRLMSE